ncbi:MAG: PEP/pyruvate-binding domain-containing protein [bacterium]
MSRIIKSAIYRELGPYQAVKRQVFASETRNVHLVGEGDVGGKGIGTLVLHRQRENWFTYHTPRSVILCEDALGLPVKDIESPNSITAISIEKIEEVVTLLRELDFQPAIAIRSSAQVEDGAALSTAGRFRTEFHALPLNDHASIRAFTEKLLRVCNSAYSNQALPYWQRGGYQEIPPMPVVIQEVVGGQWSYAPRYFLPAISGLLRVLPHDIALKTTVVGLGLSAVQDAGLGLSRRFVIDPHRQARNQAVHMYDERGSVNLQDLFALDLEAGDLVRLRGQEAEQLYPEEIHRTLWSFVVSDMGADVALAFNKTFGRRFEFEWAHHPNHGFSLVQVRPVVRTAKIAKPEVSPENIILSTDNVLGAGRASFDHLIVFEQNRKVSRVPIERVESLYKTYPNSLFVQVGEVTGVTACGIEENVFPFASAAVVSDTVDSIIHQQGSGVQHLAVRFLNEEKVMIYTGLAEGRFWQRPEMSLLKFIPLDCMSTSRQYIYVYSISRPVHVAADAEEGWGMVWLG